MCLYAAPLQGITTHRFRSLHAEMFGGVDCYFTPFFSPAAEHLMTRGELRDLTPDHNDTGRVVPQIMTRRGEDFVWAAETLLAMGYRQVNLNLGCPSGTVTAKGKGAGFLARPEELEGFLKEIFAALPKGTVSVKTRLGYREPEEFRRLLEIYNGLPLRELIIHPRVREDFYKRPVRREDFARYLPLVQAPVCYNGDLITVEDCRQFSARFPQVERVMLGRGLAADPALARKLRGGKAASREELMEFTGRLYQGYREDYGGAGPAAQRMKELWFYLIHLFDGGEKYGRNMRRVAKPREYEELEAGIFRDLPLRQEPAGVL